MYTKSGRPLQVSGDKVYSRSGKIVGRIKGEKVYATDGRYVGTIGLSTGRRTVPGSVLRSLLPTVLGPQGRITLDQPFGAMSRTFLTETSASIDAGCISGETATQ